MFKELKASLEEANAIEKGEKNASRDSRYEVVDVESIRSQLGVSQEEFAAGLGISVDTIKSWEIKSANPTGMAAKVLATLWDNPEYFENLASH